MKWLTSNSQSDLSQFDGIIKQENRYINLSEESFQIPSISNIRKASSILKAFPQLNSSTEADEIAIREYCHFVMQTYYFEVLGFQVLSSMAIASEEFTFLHEVAQQAIDEARHIQIYSKICGSLPYQASICSSIPSIFREISETSSLPEKCVKGFLCLESLAIGIFSSRLQFFSKECTQSIDQLILEEERDHQLHAVNILTAFGKAGKLTFADFKRFIAEGIAEMSLEILPHELLKEIGCKLDSTAFDSMTSQGFIGFQRKVSRANLIQNIRYLTRTLKHPE